MNVVHSKQRRRQGSDRMRNTTSFCSSKEENFSSSHLPLSMLLEAMHSGRRQIWLTPNTALQQLLFHYLPIFLYVHVCFHHFIKTERGNQSDITAGQANILEMIQKKNPLPLSSYWTYQHKMQGYFRKLIEVELKCNFILMKNKLWIPWVS